jgi:hypothetical protein
MASQYPLCRLALALVAVSLVACGPRPGDAASDSIEEADSGGLPTKGEDSGLGTKDDSGLGTKDDSGLGTKDDSGLGTSDDAGEATDAGTATEDAGTGTEDAGTGTQDAGTSGPPDAGGFGGCFECAEEKCAMQTTCVGSWSRVEEGECDLVCIDEASGTSHGPTSACLASCTKGQKATPNLLTGLTCAFTTCAKECHPPVTCFRAGGLP